MDTLDEFLCETLFVSGLGKNDSLAIFKSLENKEEKILFLKDRLPQMETVAEMSKFQKQSSF